MPALAKFALIVHSVSGGNAVLMLHPVGSTDAEGAKLKLRGISARLAGELEAARLDEQPMRKHWITCDQALWRNNIATLAIDVLDQCDVSRAIWIILQTLNNTWHTIFITLEIDYAIALLMAAAMMARSNASIIVTAAIFTFLL